MQQTSQVKSAGVLEHEEKLPPAERLAELRAIAMSALAFGADGIDLWRCYGELKHLDAPESMKAELLEARIGVAVAKRIRPAATLRNIKALRELRADRGEDDKFDAFETLFLKSLGNIRLTNHSYRATNFGDMDHAPVWDTVAGHIAFLKERDYPTFLNSGTLLGVVRDQRLIDHDDDIDLAVVLKSSSLEGAAEEWKALTQHIRDVGLLDETSFNDPAVVKLLPIHDIQIDLFPCWILEDRVYLYPHTNGELHISDVLPLKTCAVTGNPIPAHPEKMLAVNYGDSWRDPDPYFKFPWPQQRRVFERFLQRLA